MPHYIRFAASAAVLAGLIALSAPSAQAAPTPAADAFSIGAIKAYSLVDAVFVLPNDGKIFGGNAGSAGVTQVLSAAGAPTDTVTLGVDALLLKDGKHIVLIDTGNGAKAGGVLQDSLAKTGIAADVVTDVLITHAHPDHIGGLVTADGALAFPHATIRMSAPEWASLQSQTDNAALVKVIAPQVKTFALGAAVLPGIRSVDIKGHTPGHSGYEISSGKARLLDIGDTAHSSIVSLTEPDWTMGFDGDKAEAAQSRRAELTKLAKSQERIFAPHFPFPGVGTIKADGDHFAWAPDASVN